MKTLIIVPLLLLLFGVNNSYSQCSGGNLFQTFTLNNNCTNIPTSTLSNVTWFGDYNVINNLAIGSTVTFTITGSGCITVRTGSPTGPVVTFGTSTVTFTATTTTVYVVYRANCTTCGTSSTNQTSTIAYTAPTTPTPQDCEGATQLCSSNSFSANSSGSCNQELTAPLGIASYNGACASNSANPTTIGSAHWNTQFAIQKAACEATYGVGNCILNGGGAVGCGGGQNRYRFDFLVNPPGSNAGCLVGGENQSSWYYVYINQAGVLTMNLAPNTAADDYDFAIWGPYNASTAAANCSPTQAPIRCSWSSTAGGTGLAVGETDFSEGAFGGNSYVAPINANIGDVYILLVDNFSNSGQPYGISWGGTAGLGCTPIALGIDLINFSGQNIGSKNLLQWSTNSENNVEQFMIERSTDGITWELVNSINATGVNNDEKTVNEYRVLDDKFNRTMNYYRLSEVSYDGNKINISTINIDNSLNSKTISKIINTMGQEVTKSYKGVVFYLFTDGTSFKTVQ